MKKNLFDLTDRVAIVTGGATGLGYGMAEALKNHGCTVSIWGRRKDVVDEAAATLGVHSVVCDVTKKAEVEDAFRKTTDEFGRIRDVREGPDGALWFLSVGDGVLYRMTPAN